MATTALRNARAITLRDRKIEVVNAAGDAWKTAFPDQPALGATWVYDPATSTLTGTPVGFEGDPPDPSLIVSVMPSDLPRGLTAITATIGGVSFPLLDALGNPLTASQLTPGRLHVMCRTSAAFQIMEPLGKRPQDFLIRFAHSGTVTLTEEQIAAGATSATGVIEAGEMYTSGRQYFYFGVPDGVADIAYIGKTLGYDNLAGGNIIERFVKVAETVNDPLGVAYKWWRSERTDYLAPFSETWNVQIAPVVAV